MIAEGYELHVYCDFDEDCALLDLPHSYLYDNSGEFCGHTKGEAYAEAKTSGFHIKQKERQVICPHCWKAGKRFKDLTAKEKP